VFDLKTRSQDLNPSAVYNYNAWIGPCMDQKMHGSDNAWIR